jgi:hypothetical protein
MNDVIGDGGQNNQASGPLSAEARRGRRALRLKGIVRCVDLKTLVFTIPLRGFNPCQAFLKA